MYAGTGFIQCVDCFVREVAVADITFCQLHTSLQGFGRIDHIVVFFVAGLDILQDLQSLFRCCRIDDHFLETTFQSSVFLDILTMFIECRSTDTLYFSTGQGRLQHIGGIH